MRGSRRNGGGVTILDPFDWRNTNERLEYRTILNEVAKMLRVSQRPELGSVNTAVRMYAFSGGLMGETMRLLRKAYQAALEEGSPTLSHEHLADAVDTLRRGYGDADRENPFRVETPSSELAPAAPKPKTDEKADRRRRKKALENEGFR